MSAADLATSGLKRVLDEKGAASLWLHGNSIGPDGAGFVGGVLCGLQAPVRAEPGVCISPTMVTTKRQRLRAHNATVSQVKSDFKASETAASLKRFLSGHDALLKALMEREKVRVY